MAPLMLAVVAFPIVALWRGKGAVARNVNTGLRISLNYFRERATVVGMRRGYTPRPGVPRAISKYMAELGRSGSVKKKVAAAKRRWELHKARTNLSATAA